MPGPSRIGLSALILLEIDRAVTGLGCTEQGKSALV